MSALTTRAFPSPVVDFSDRYYFMAQRDGNGGAYVSASYIGKISRRRIFNQSIARASEQLGFEGVIGISAYVEDLEAFYAAIARPEDNAMIALLRTDGQALAGYPATWPADVEKLSVALFEAKLTKRFGMRPSSGTARGTG